MKRAVLTAAIVLASAGVAMASAQAPAEYHELLNNYCVTCHNQAAGIPDANPLYLDLANLDDPVQDAEIWENVIRKTGVGAMPPLGMPAPDRGELAEFRLWLATTLDIANAELNDPGRKLIHRLNRVEYGNAIRDLLDIEVDTTELLPSDGGDFGFDNIAAALTTSPLLLERYLTAALRISTAAVGDTEVAPGATTFNIAMEVSQEQHMEGLPLGTRGGGKVLYNFPADGEYQFSGVLLRTVAEGYVGVEGHETPHEFVIMIDGEVVYSAELGGPEDHEAHGEDILAIRTVLDERMSTRVPVTAGPHEVVFSFTERPASEQDVWQPAIRSSQEVHFTSGPPRLERMIIEGPYEVTGISDTPSRDRLFLCRPASDASADETAACANEILSNVARRAFRRPVAEADLVEPMGFYRSARVSGGDFDAGIRSGLALILASPSFVFRVERDSADLLPGAAHDISEVELASRLSFFLWSSIPDDELLDLAIAGQLRAPGVLEAQITAHGRRQARRRDGVRFHGSMAPATHSGTYRTGHPAVPGVRRQPPPGVPARNGTVLRQHSAGEPEHAQSSGRRLHIRQRAPGPPLRHPRSVWQPLPKNRPDRSKPVRPTRPREYSVDHIGFDENFARDSRQVHPDQLV